MLTTNILFKKAMGELIALFGTEYLKANYENTCRASGMIDTQTYQLFVGIKGADDLPGRKSNEKGWVVFAKILLDATTGKVKQTEYALE